MTDSNTAADPRKAPSNPVDVRPLVGRADFGPPVWTLIAVLVLAGLLLFTILEARRRATSAPATFPAVTQADLSRSPPPLFIPPTSTEPVFSPSMPAPASATPPVISSRDVPREPTQVFGPPPSYGSTIQPPPLQPVASRNAGGAAIVIDNSQARLGTAADGAVSTNSRVPGVATDRTRAGMFANRAATVPQGTLIQAVLETAFDSTSPGFSRALVQRDVRGFDGSRVLIPRGSRLIGEYRSDSSQGQKRVMIVWTRLLRPDGVTMALASPSADPVGRGGVRAQVDSHFWERFGGAILQSSLDLGVGLATRSTRSPVIVAGSVSNATGTVIPQATAIPPTLKVAAGTSVSVFVARDLDFSGTTEAQ